MLLCEIVPVLAPTFEVSFVFAKRKKEIYHSDLEGFGDSPNTVDVFREEVPSQADFGIVC
jgi:hypothetical protein